jgi:hypothetical protein
MRTPHLLGSLVVTALLSLSAHAQTPDSGKFFTQLGELIQTAEGRADLKKALDRWTPAQKKEVTNNISAALRQYSAETMPLTIDRYETYINLQIYNKTIFVQSLLSDEFPDSDAHYLKAGLINVVCQSPYQALMIALGYKYQMNYSRENGKHVLQAAVTDTDCGF